MLTEAELNLVQRAFAQGPAALIESGYTDEEQKEFLAREDVRAHFLLLEREMDHSEALQIRQRMITRRSLGKLSNGAVAVLGQALAGPKYLVVTDEKSGKPVVSKEANGRPIIAHPEPTPMQIRAAEVILEAQGVQQQKARNDTGIGANVNVEILFKGDTKAAVEITDDPEHVKESQRALSRERVRTVIDILASKVPELHNNLRQNIGLPLLPLPAETIKDADVTVRPVRKRAKKKVAKKATKKKATKKKTTKKPTTKKTSGRKKTTRKKAPTKR